MSVPSKSFCFAALFCAALTAPADEKINGPTGLFVGETVVSGYVTSTTAWQIKARPYPSNSALLIPIFVPGGYVLGYGAVALDHTFRPYFFQFWLRH